MVSLSRPGRGQAEHHAEPHAGILAPAARPGRRRAPSAALSRKRRRSSPIAAAGTRPKCDNTE